MPPIPKISQRFGWGISVALILGFLFFYSGPSRRALRADEGVDHHQHPSLTFMSLENEQDEQYERKRLQEFSKQSGIGMQFAKWPQTTTSSRLSIYQDLFRLHSPNPDVLEIDVIWPRVLADDLVDLKPYLGKQVEAFAPDLIQNFTVDGRLVALPILVDTGVLYCRRDLLQKYGFTKPPKTWEELGRMAQFIQAGERREGNNNFWGYVWQGHSHEGLTCNALEWQASEGAGTILDRDGRPSVSNPKMVRALKRTLSWIGTISPPGENAYWETDSLYLWQAGNAAFMRNWADWYGMVNDTSDSHPYPVEVAVLPAGENGHKGTLGGVGIGVSKYSRNKREALAVLRLLTSESTQINRALTIGSIPSRVSLREREDLMAHTALSGPAAHEVMTSLVARPSTAAGKDYDSVSQAYIRAVHSALTRKETPEVAMAKLQTELTQIIGSVPSK